MTGEGREELADGSGSAWTRTSPAPWILSESMGKARSALEAPLQDGVDRDRDEDDGAVDELRPEVGQAHRVDAATAVANEMSRLRCMPTR